MLESVLNRQYSSQLTSTNPIPPPHLPAPGGPITGSFVPQTATMTAMNDYVVGPGQIGTIIEKYEINDSGEQSIPTACFLRQCFSTLGSQDPLGSPSLYKESQRSFFNILKVFICIKMSRKAYWLYKNCNLIRPTSKDYERLRNIDL